MIEYLWFINQAGAGIQAEGDASTARTNAANALSRSEEVSYRLGAIELAVETLIRLGVDQSKFSEEEFLAKAREIDAEDGIIDGRRDLNRMRKICDKCGKPSGGTKASCMWCGADLTHMKPVPNDL